MSSSINKLIIKVDQSAAIARLVEYGKEQGHVTYEDILKILPEAEEDPNWLENAFAALINADIQYLDDDGDIESDKRGSDRESESDHRADDNSIWQGNIYYSPHC